MDYDVVIIGAGPAGLFTAYELITKNSKLNILLLDQGRFAHNRNCPMKKTQSAKVIYLNIWMKMQPIN